MADAHFNRALFWQTDAQRHGAHMNAARLHRDRATQLEFHYHSIHPGSHSDPYLLAFRRKCLSSKDAAYAGSTHLKASNAYKKAYELADRAGDLPTAVETATQIIAHDKKSLNHTPLNAKKFSSMVSLFDGAEAIRRANQISRKYGSEASGSGRHH